MNRKKLLLESIALLLIFGSIWGIFTIFPIGPKKTVFRLSVEKEERLGELLLKATLSNPEFRKVENDTAGMALGIITERLTSALDSERYVYHCILVDNTIANAFALPGGNVLITTGLLTILKSPEECAAVLAHEIGHIEKRHTLSKLLANFTTAILFSDDALVSEAADLLTTSAFSRRQEEEADRFGLALLEKSGINPRIMGTAFRHLKDESGAYNPKMEIIMSHPDMDSRIRTAYQYPLKKDFTEEKFTINWDIVRNQFTHQISQ